MFNHYKIEKLTDERDFATNKIRFQEELIESHRRDLNNLGDELRRSQNQVSDLKAKLAGFKPQDELEAEVAKLRAEIRIITMEFQAVLNHQGQKAQEAIDEVMKQANEKLAAQAKSEGNNDHQ